MSNIGAKSTNMSEIKVNLAKCSYNFWTPHYRQMTSNRKYMHCMTANMKNLQCLITNMKLMHCMTANMKYMHCFITNMKNMHCLITNMKYKPSWAEPHPSQIRCWVPKTFESKNDFVATNSMIWKYYLSYCSETIWFTKKCWSHKNLGFKKIWVPEMCWSQKCWFSKNCWS